MLDLKKGKYHSVGWWQLKITEDLPRKVKGVDELTKVEFDESIDKGMRILSMP